MWKAKLINGDEFTLNDNEARAVTAAMQNRLPVNLGYAVINGVSVASLIDEEKSRIKTNPIINDPDFLAWANGNTRRLDGLNSRYSGEKFQLEWKEALAYKKLIESGEVKLLE